MVNHMKPSFALSDIVITQIGKSKFQSNASRASLSQPFFAYVDAETHRPVNADNFGDITSSPTWENHATLLSLFLETGYFHAASLPKGHPFCQDSRILGDERVQKGTHIKFYRGRTMQIPDAIAEFADSIDNESDYLSIELKKNTASKDRAILYFKPCGSQITLSRMTTTSTHIDLFTTIGRKNPFRVMNALNMYPIWYHSLRAEKKAPQLYQNLSASIAA